MARTAEVYERINRRMANEYESALRTLENFHDRVSKENSVAWTLQAYTVDAVQAEHTLQVIRDWVLAQDLGRFEEVLRMDISKWDWKLLENPRYTSQSTSHQSNLVEGAVKESMALLRAKAVDFLEYLAEPAAVTETGEVNVDKMIAELKAKASRVKTTGPRGAIRSTEYGYKNGLLEAIIMLCKAQGHPEFKVDETTHGLYESCTRCGSVQGTAELRKIKAEQGI